MKPLQPRQPSAHHGDDVESAARQIGELVRLRAPLGQVRRQHPRFDVLADSPWAPAVTPPQLDPQRQGDDDRRRDGRTTLRGQHRKCQPGRSNEHGIGRRHRDHERHSTRHRRGADGKRRNRECQRNNAYGEEHPRFARPCAVLSRKNGASPPLCRHAVGRRPPITLHHRWERAGETSRQ